MLKFVLLRHGESQWNLENKFTGWIDAPLSEAGREEAKKAGALLVEAGFEFDQAFTSVLQRAVGTMCLVLKELGQLWVPDKKTWRLNERHYGALQGQNKKELIEKEGKEQVFTWRRSYNTPPPLLDKDDPTHPRFDRRYKGIAVPSGESLMETQKRCLSFWESDVAPSLRAGKSVLLVAHGNSLRALIKYLEGISDEDICKLDIPTGRPLVCELDDDLNFIRSDYL